MLFEACGLLALGGIQHSRTIFGLEEKDIGELSADWRGIVRHRDLSVARTARRADGHLGVEDVFAMDS